MSKEALQEKIDKIRDAVEDESITNTQVAEILTELNEEKLEKDLSNLPEEQKALLRGDHGYSAYEIWLSLGNEGTEQDFINSLKGERGQRGLVGLSVQGDVGPVGPPGRDGRDGRDGQSYHITKADSEEEAIALSIGNPQHIIYWT